MTKFPLCSVRERRVADHWRWRRLDILWIRASRISQFFEISLEQFYRGPRMLYVRVCIFIMGIFLLCNRSTYNRQTNFLSPQGTKFQRYLGNMVNVTRRQVFYKTCVPMQRLWRLTLKILISTMKWVIRSLYKIYRNTCIVTGGRNTTKKVRTNVPPPIRRCFKIAVNSVFRSSSKNLAMFKNSSVE